VGRQHVLAHGSIVEVLEPPELRQMVAERAEVIARLYRRESFSQP